MRSSFRFREFWPSFLVLLPFLLNGCSPSNKPASFTVSGTVVNLAGTGLVLQDNGSENLSISANGAFTFSTSTANSGTYDVTISTQPSNPAQTCTVANGTGMASANVTNITVNCGHNEWAWMSGANTQNQPGTYGTQGTAAAANVPGVRNVGPVSWTDTYGNLWLFGGNGIDSTGTIGDLNDLWEYNISSGLWTWMSGSNLANQAGAYGTLNMPAPGNVPGARDGAIGWTDSSGNLWLFGGEFAIFGSTVFFNDLWEYSISSGQWTWKGGSNTTGQNGNYGTLNVPGASNVPGARDYPVAKNISGVVWLFGGFGNDSAGTQDFLNDLWQYTINSGEWTWVGGSNLAGQKGVYGPKGTADMTNIPSAPIPSAPVPSARFQAVSWADAMGNFWIFGGVGLDSAGTNGELNDLWEYSTVSKEWTWLGGAKVARQNGVYGTQGTTGASNVPGSRCDAFSWTDPSGNFWLFGGFGNDSANPQVELNDLWEYSVSTNEWTWKSGPNVGGGNGVYGTLGKLAPGNIPDNREGGASWTDASGNLWLFGGSGVECINDLWMYFP